MMQKSIVHQFPAGLNRSVYRMSSVQKSFNQSRNSSFDRQIHLKKSRIANIPDSKKQDLSEKLNFVVVFQTIEIERLSQEVQTLRIRVKQYQRQLFNGDNYEVQIKQLTERCCRLEKDKNSYMNQLSQNQQASQLIFQELEELKKRSNGVDYTVAEKYKLQKSRNQDLIAQVEKWKARYNAIDQSKSDQLNSIKKIMEEQTRNSLSRETRDLVDRFQLEREEVDQLVKELKQINVQKQTQLKKVKHMLSNNEKQLVDFQRQIDEYEEKVAMLSQQNYRLNELCKNKQSELTKLKQKIEELTQATLSEAGQKSNEFKKLQAKLQRVYEELQSKKDLICKLEKTGIQDKEKLLQTERITFLLSEAKQEINSKNRNLERKEKKIQQCEEQINKLYKIGQEVRVLKSQNEQMKVVIDSLIKSLTVKAQQARKHRKIAQKANSKIQSHFVAFKEEATRKTQQIIQFCDKLQGQIQLDKQYIASLEEKTEQQISKTNILLNQKISLTEQVQEARYEMQKQRGLSSQLSQTGQMLQKTRMQNQCLNNELNTLKIAHKKEISEYMSELKKYQETLSQKHQNILKADEAMSQSKTQIGHLTKQLEKVTIEKTTCQKGLTQLILESQNQKQKILTLMNRLEVFGRIINQLKGLIGKLHSQSSKQRQSSASMQLSFEEVLAYLSNLINQNQELYNSFLSSESDLIALNKSSMVTGSQNMTSRDRMDKIGFNGQKLEEGIGQQINYYGEQASLLTKVSLNQNINLSNMADSQQNRKLGKLESFNNYSHQLQHHNTDIPMQFLIRHMMICAEVESLRARVGDKQAKLEQMKSSMKGSAVSNVSSAKERTNTGINPSFSSNMPLTSSNMLMSNTFINKLTPFTDSRAEDPLLTHSNHRMTQTSDRWGALGKRVTSQEHTQGNYHKSTVGRVNSPPPAAFATADDQYSGSAWHKPQSGDINSRDSRGDKNSTIYTNKKVSGPGNLVRGGFKSISISKKY